MSFLNAKINIRLRERDKEEIERIAEDYPGLFENPNHVIRCAIIRFINTERKNKEEWKSWFQAEETRY